MNDQLQEQVPETIDFLLAAGVKVIVLTGDKRETAETIAKDCHIIQPDMHCVYVKSTKSPPPSLAPSPLPTSSASTSVGSSPGVHPRGALAVPATLHPGIDTPMSEEEMIETTKASLAECIDYIQMVREGRELIGDDIDALRPSLDPNALAESIEDHRKIALATASLTKSDTTKTINNESGGNIKHEEGVEMASLGQSMKNKANMNVDYNNNNSDLSPGNNNPKIAIKDKNKPRFIALLSGKTLQIALTKCEAQFITLFLACASIVTYRSTPRQKAIVVDMVKNKLNSTCLAIGDGANDVSMIQEAHVGIGILGKEGSHAAMSADYVLHRFAHLKQLLFVQGRYCLYRTTKVVMLSFYKNFVFVMPVVWFSFHNGFSGQVICSAYFMSVYNLLFTSVPPLVIGIFERDVPEKLLRRVPEAYYFFKRENLYSFPELFRWLFLSMIQSLIFYFFTLEVFYKDEISGVDGKIDDLWFGGSTMCFSIVMCVNIILLLHVDSISWVNWIGFVIGFVTFFIAYIVLSVMWQPDLSPETYGVIHRAFLSPKQWLYLLLTIVLCLLIWHLWRSIQTLYFPYFYQGLQALAKKEEQDAAARASSPKRKKGSPKGTTPTSMDSGVGENGIGNYQNDNLKSVTVDPSSSSSTANSSVPVLTSPTNSSSSTTTTTSIGGGSGHSSTTPPTRSLEILPNSSPDITSRTITSSSSSLTTSSLITPTASSKSGFLNSEGSSSATVHHRSLNKPDSHNNNNNNTLNTITDGVEDDDEINTISVPDSTKASSPKLPTSPTGSVTIHI